MHSSARVAELDGVTVLGRGNLAALRTQDKILRKLEYRSIKAPFVYAEPYRYTA